MHKWTWSLTAVALLGLAAGCSKGRNDNTNDQNIAALERDRAGNEVPVENQDLEVIGGENLADQEFYGTVTGVADNSMTVRNKGGTTMTLEFGEETRFISRGQQADQAQLHEGSQVRAAYDETEGKYEATTVELFPKATTPQQKK
ncbi:MAG TPA: hypothetical protein VF794_33090 [Archangium sp.]|jgi:hypothetical protein|uniref:hypothetical protein n=1 Tax=Archangium sp. TaxID=1872627 RepID=UPI002EDB37FE